MARYIYYIVFACAFGACSGQDPQDDPLTHNQCVCKPTIKMNFNNEDSSTGYMCNNKTFDWVVKAMVTKVAQQVDEIEELKAKIAELNQENERKQDVFYKTINKLQACEKEVATLKESLHFDKRKLGELKEENMHAKDCADIQTQGYHYSGLYTIYPYTNEPNKEVGVEVFCDLNTDDGGWLVLQRRQDGSHRFDRNWEAYKKGFGQPAREFWIGNKLMHTITRQRHYELRVDLTDFSGTTYYALYDRFAVESEENEYTLRLGQYQGNAGDSLGHHSDQAFSTVDRDNDLSKSGNCAELYGGGWWYVRCYDSNLNGEYLKHHAMEAVVWYHLEENHKPLKHVEMKIRPYNFKDIL